MLSSIHIRAQHLQAVNMMQELSANTCSVNSERKCSEIELEFNYTFHGIRLPLVQDIRCAQGPAGPVVVHRGGLELAELREELLDVGLGDPGVQVGDHQLAGPARAQADAGSGGRAPGEPVVLPPSRHVAPHRAGAGPGPHGRAPAPASASEPPGGGPPAPASAPGAPLAGPPAAASAHGHGSPAAGPRPAPGHLLAAPASACTTASAAATSAATGALVGLYNLIQTHINSVSHCFCSISETTVLIGLDLRETRLWTQEDNSNNLHKDNTE